MDKTGVTMISKSVENLRLFHLLPYHLALRIGTPTSPGGGFVHDQERPGLI